MVKLRIQESRFFSLFLSLKTWIKSNTLWVEKLMKATYLTATRPELRKRESSDVRKRGLKLRMYAQSQEFSFYYFQQTPPSAFITISYLFLFLIQHIRDDEVLTPPRATIHHSRSLSRWRTQWTRRRVRRGWFHWRYAWNGPLHGVNSLVVLVSA